MEKKEMDIEEKAKLIVETIREDTKRVLSKKKDDIVIVREVEIDIVNVEIECSGV